MFKFFKFGATALIVSVCIASFTSCVKDDFSGEELGTFSLSLSADDAVVETSTKAPDNIDVTKFNVKITTLGGDELKSWASYAEMPEVVRFGKGNYLIHAIGGDSTTTAFDAPSYRGTSKLSVYKSEQQNVSVVCKINKMVVSVVVAEGMKSYYSDYSTEVSVSAKSKLTYIKDEARQGYFPVGALSAKILLTRKDGSQFEATMPQLQNTKAGEHYIITFSTKNGLGSIDVTLKEASTNDNIIETVIPAEATASLPPYFVASSGFTLESPVVSVIETGTADVRMLIKARGYIKNCIIGVKSAHLISQGVPREFNLTSTSYNPELAAILKSVGMVWSDNMSSSTMAEIDFSGMLKLLPADVDKSYDHVLTIKVEDMYQRVSESLPLRLSVSYPIVEIDNVSRAQEVNGEAEVDLECTVENGSFDNLNRIEILNGFTWETLNASRYTLEVNNSDTKKATVKITKLPISNSQFSFRLVHKNPTIGIERFSEQITAYLVTPKITMDVLNATTIDGVERVPSQNNAQLSIKIESTDPSFNFDANKLQLKVRNQGSWENIGRIVSSDPTSKTAVMEVTNLTPSEKYRIRCVYDGRYNSNNEGIFQTDGFHFENWSATQTFSNVEHGGRIGWKKIVRAAFWGGATRSEGYNDYEKTSIIADNIADPIWATNGSKTIKSDFSPYNSWYMVPSVLKTSGYMGGNGVVLRSVAWDNKGPVVTDGDMSKITDPSDPGSSIGGSTAINYNTRDQVPSADLTNAFKSSGKLFLGKYNCIHDTYGGAPNETYNETGLKLKSKPAGVSFYYKFTSCEGDSGSARVVVYDADNNEIGAGELIISSDAYEWSHTNLQIVYVNQAKADHINIVFSSSVADKFANAPTAEMQQNIKLKSDNITTRNATGNILSIDELELKY